MKEEKLNNEIIIYTSDGGQAVIDVRIDGETVWLSQAQLAELFGTTKQNISLHIINIFDEGELSREATVKEYLIVQKEGGRAISRKIEHYSILWINHKQYILRKTKPHTSPQPPVCYQF
ncbi:MAG: hypothetical protein P1P90_02890 [Patescibacteria group bacterium]|nr:hypothetical protein [Patescibacteria group bacterium]